MQPSLERLGVLESQVVHVEALRKKLAGSPTEVTLKRHEGSGLDDLTLTRWLRARDWVVEDAATDLAKHAAWHEDIAPSGSVDEALLVDHFKDEKVYLQGTLSSGMGLAIVMGGKHKPGASLDNLKMFIAYTLDKAFKCVDFEKNPCGLGAMLLDMQGWTVRHADVKGLKACFQLLAYHYPERLGFLIVYEAPTLFWAMWTAVCPFIDKVTKDKIRFVYKKDCPAAWEGLISLDMLPKLSGGNAEPVPVQLAEVPQSPPPAAAGVKPSVV